jgi:hypothetical protein
MVRELGVDAAEARIKEAAQVIAPKTDTVNKTEIRFFIRKSLVLEHEFAAIPHSDAPCRAVERSAQRTSHCQRRLSALLHRTRQRKTFRDIVGDQEGSDRVASHRELPSSSARPQEKRITRA